MKHHIRLLSGAALALLLAQTVATPANAAAATIAAPVATEISTGVTVGGDAQFRFSEPDGSDPAVAYTWSVIGESQYTVDAVDGVATVPVFAVGQSNVLDVTARSADGQFSAGTRVVFGATNPPPAADQDLTGDGLPDLIADGGTTGLTSGMWQAAGQGTKGKVVTPAVNASPDGNGVGSSFDGAQIITGKFTGGPFEDYLAFYPALDQALIYKGFGAATTAHPEVVELSETGGAPTSDWDGNTATELVNAYDSSGNGTGFPDLMGVAGSAANGYGLFYYPNVGGPGANSMGQRLTATTPTGGTDWDSWRIASKLLPSGTAIVLWNQATGALYLWEGLTVDPGAGAAAYTQYKLATKWEKGADFTSLRLTDFNADGVPDLWAVKPAGTVTAYTISGLSAAGTAKIKAGSPQHLQ
jgi:hypothetical protein